MPKYIVRRSGPRGGNVVYSLGTKVCEDADELVPVRCAGHGVFFEAYAEKSGGPVYLAQKQHKVKDRSRDVFAALRPHQNPHIPHITKLGSWYDKTRSLYITRWTPSLSPKRHTKHWNTYLVLEEIDDSLPIGMAHTTYWRTLLSEIDANKHLPTSLKTAFRLLHSMSSSLRQRYILDVHSENLAVYGDHLVLRDVLCPAEYMYCDD